MGCSAAVKRGFTVLMEFVLLFICGWWDGLRHEPLTEKGFASKSCVLEPHGIGTLRFSVCSITKF